MPQQEEAGGLADGAVRSVLTTDDAGTPVMIEEFDAEGNSLARHYLQDTELTE